MNNVPLHLMKQVLGDRAENMTPDAVAATFNAQHGDRLRGLNEQQATSYAMGIARYKQAEREG